MIALYFGIPLNEVEEVSIIDYRLMIFTIFNNAILNSMDPSKFNYMDEDERYNDLEREHKRIFPSKWN